MKVFIYSLPIIFSVILLLSCGTESTPESTPEGIFLDKNGITVKCPNSMVGDTGVVNGIEYEVVDDELLRQRIEEGRDLTKLCVSNVTDMSNLFQGGFRVDEGIILTPNTFNQPIGNWDVSSVTNMVAMFGVTEFNQPIRHWDVSSVVNMNSMFKYSQFNQPIGDWDVSSVVNMKFLFDSSQFNQNIQKWDVGNVEGMNMMFYDTQFNQPIGDWDVSSVIMMDGMFNGSTFNQNISGWCVTNIPNEPHGFSGFAPLIEEYKPKWGTCPD